MIRRQIDLPAEPERVWEALTEPDQAAGWFGGAIEWEVEEGAPLRFTDDDGSTRHGEVEVVRPGRYLRYRWWSDDDTDSSEVSYLLEPVAHPGGDRTRLTIQERALRPDRADQTEMRLGPSGAPAVRPTDGSWTRWDGLLAAVWALLAAPAFSRIVA